MTVSCEERYAPQGCRVHCIMCHHEICYGDRYTAMLKPNPQAILGTDVVGNYCHNCMPQSPCDVICMDSGVDTLGPRPCGKCGQLLYPGDEVVKSGIRSVWRYDHPPLSLFHPACSPCAEAAA